MITYNQYIMEISPSTVTGLLGLGGAGYMLGNQMTSNDAGTTTMPSNPVGYLGDQAGKLKEWWNKPGIFSALKDPAAYINQKTAEYQEQQHNANMERMIQQQKMKVAEQTELDKQIQKNNQLQQNINSQQQEIDKMNRMNNYLKAGLGVGLSAGAGALGYSLYNKNKRVG